ncbi:MAG: translation initiation factor IF-2 [Thermodesulfobacteriota bacterium]
MAKIRVYELARDLNMENKALLEKLVEMKVDVKSHMSSLDDEIIDQVKDFVIGKKKETVVETRVKPTVIRRRVKQVTVKTAPPEEPVSEAAEPAEADTVADQGEAIPVQEAPAAAEAQEIQAEAQAAPPAVAPVEPEAKIEEPAPVDEAITPAADLQPATPPQPKKEKPAKVVKKAKKEIPAKIIKLPTVRPEKAPEPEKVPKEADAPVEKDKIDKKAPAKKLKGEPAPLPKDAEELKDKSKKKGKWKAADAVEDPKFFKKKISFKRKEIIERADLYAEEPRLRKGRKGVKAKPVKGQKTQITTPKAIKRRIKIDDAIVLSDLAKRMGVKANEMIAKLMTLGVIATVNQTIDFETAALVAAEFDYELEKAAFEEDTVLKKIEEEDPAQLTHRPPVVTIMGHVDHGKTSLLDVIRKTSVTELEAGGITQHIGAYNVSTEKGQIVFLDTPGHEAFTAMRSRGAKITDIVVLVVAADDGVMPQTIEAINHSKAAGVPIIVAVNKIDKANADPARSQRQLAEVGLTPEDWGGDTIFVNVSAKTHEGIDSLLEMILLQAELMELKANPQKLAVGHVVEAKLDSGRGPVATVLVQNGTLRTGDTIVCGVHYGKIRAMLNDKGERVESAGPSIPVEVLGLSGVPMAGDDLTALDDEKQAKQVSLHRIQKQRSKDLAKTSRLSLEKLYESLQAGEVRDLNLIIKADVEGSIEALRDSLVKLSNEEVKINVIHAATGTITESDVSLAAVSEAIIIGFNVRPSPKVQDIANEENVEMNFYSVIYDVIKDVQDAIVGLMSSTFEERILGRAEVREVFHVPKVGAIGGSYVTDGKIERGRPVRVLRDGIVTYEGKISSLRRFKDDAKEVQTGYECGIGIENFNDIKVGDVFECYYLEEIKPELA